MQEMTGCWCSTGGFLFLNVFLVQAGAPVPAVPTLMVAGALASARTDAARHRSRIGGGFAARRPDLVCLRAHLRPARAAAAVPRLDFARFVRASDRRPLSALGRAVADVCQVHPRVCHGGAATGGRVGLELVPFLGYSAISAALWAGLAAGAGMLFSSQIEWLLPA